MRFRHLSLAAGALLVSVCAYAAVKSITADSSKFSDSTNQYKTWQQTAESKEVIDVLAEDPNLVVLWAG